MIEVDKFLEEFHVPEWSTIGDGIEILRVKSNDLDDDPDLLRVTIEWNSNQVGLTLDINQAKSLFHYVEQHIYKFDNK